jgi:hypothetical protein
MKIRPMTAELFHADRNTHENTYRQTDITKLLAAFRKIAKNEKKPSPKLYAYASTCKMLVNHQSNTDVNSVYYAVRPLYCVDVYTEIITLHVTVNDGTAI